MSHLAMTVLCATGMAAVAAVPGKRPLRARVVYSSYLAAMGVASVIAGSWVMHWIHG
jgi:hypothetical protein